MSDATPQKTNFKTSDGAVLQGRWYVPDSPKTVVVLSGATGVPEGFYARFATWLATERACAVLTYTYRDMEDTSPAAMRRSTANMSDWAITDGQAARDAARAQYPALPMWVIGHSLGGMMISKQPRLDGITRVITIASGLVDHHAHPLPYRWQVYAFWFWVGPLATRLMGYLPGKTIGLGSTLPARVFWQWRDWCTSGPNAFLNVDGLPASDWSRNGGNVRLVGIADDVICPTSCAFRLSQAFEGGRIETMTVRPKDHGVGKLGHFGLFREQGRPWWPQIVDA